MASYPGRLAVQQRILPAYRASFFDALAQECAGGLHVYAGQPGPCEAVLSAGGLAQAALTLGRNRYLTPRHILLVWQPGLADWLEKADPQALIVEANPRNLSLAQAVRWMHRRGRPVLGWGLGAPQETGLLGAWRTASRNRLLGSFDGVIAYSSRGAAEYLRSGLPADRIFTAANAVSPRPAGQDGIMQPRPERNGPLVVLFVGRLQPRKRVDSLLNACASLPAALQPRLVIVGDGPARPELEALARQRYPRAEFTGARSGSQLAPYFEQADLFALPGTGGLALQEAMAAGLPVIAAEADGTQEDLVRPENGWLVPPGSEEALRAALLAALSNRAQLAQMGAASARIVSSCVNLEAMVASFLRALQAVSSPARQSQPS